MPVLSLDSLSARLRRVAHLLLTAGAMLLLGARAQAQVRERPVPFDSAGRISAITPPMAARLGLAAPAWPVTGDFLDARLYEIGDSAYLAQRALEEKSAVVVGVNEFIDDEKTTLPIMVIDESVERDQVARLRAFREGRTSDWQAALARLDDAARGNGNLMPLIVDCVRNECTIGEIVGTLSRIFGEHRESF